MTAADADRTNTERVEVIHDPPTERYVVRVGGRTVGFTRYRSRPDGVRVFLHTEIDPDFGGRGLASRLIAGALAGTRDEGVRVVAECPFVRAYVQKHPDDYRELVLNPPL